jgi:outer membrane protein OmpA-like peptidoglycan-associated protein/opacity protein-like surface antigen
MSRRLVGLCAVLWLAVVPALAAGGVKGDWEIGGYFGYAFLDQYEAATRGDFRDELISDDDLNPDEDYLLGLRVGYFFTARVSLEASFQMLSSQAEFDRCLASPCPDLDTGEANTNADLDVNSLRVNVFYHWREGRSIRPFMTAGLGVEMSELDFGGGDVLDDTDLSVNAGIGVRWFLNDYLSLRLEERYVMTDVGGAVEDEQFTLQTSFGLSWTFGGESPADTDGDQVNDRKDKCPMTPQGAIVDLTGCPQDTDGDGVPDGIDLCNDTPVGSQVTSRGCPRDDDADGVNNDKDACPGTPRGADVGATGCSRDSDGDGHLDGLDQCPQTPLGAVVDDKGCPRDDDRDGVFNGLDRCPRTLVGVPVDARGCPEDDDGDGVFNNTDSCPDTPRGVQVDRDGCQLQIPVDEQPVVLEGVLFELNSAEISAASYTVLERVATQLASWTGGRIEVAGHTDAAGEAEYNQELSRRRAEAVRDYLRSRGVNDDLLVVRGFGETKPIADNSSPDGRAQNRRVTLRQLD